MASTSPQTGYVPVNGLRMYYEIHGGGQPLLILHGAFMSTGDMAPLVSGLAATRQVIAVDFQAHGRTADIDRPFAYEAFADDIAALIEHLGFDAVEVFGYSMGGGVALYLAVRHPHLIRKLVIASVSSTTDGVHPIYWEMIEMLTPEVFEGTPWKAAYEQIAPDPDNFSTLVQKMKALDLTPYAVPDNDVRSIAAPMMIIVGDSDLTTPEHAVHLFRLAGGGVFGDLAGLPNARLAVLPGTGHVGVMERASWLVPMVAEFLDAPITSEPSEATGQ